MAESATIGDLLLRTAARLPDEDALVFPTERLSYRSASAPTVSTSRCGSQTQASARVAARRSPRGPWAPIQTGGRDTLTAPRHVAAALEEAPVVVERRVAPALVDDVQQLVEQRLALVARGGRRGRSPAACARSRGRR